MAGNNNLPKHWQIKKLGEVCDVLDNLRKPVNSSERQQRISGKSKNELFPYYGATGQVGWIDSFITDGEYILIGEDGAPFLDLFKDKAYKIYGKTWVNNHAHILKGKESIILNDFILYYLNSINYREFVNGTTRLKLTKSNLVDIPFVLPPLPEQQAIVSKIEELLSDLENGKQQLQIAQQQLKGYRQSLLKLAFEGKLTRLNHDPPDLLDEHDLNMAAESQIEYIKNQGSDNLPKGWKWVKVSDVGQISTGSTPSKQNSEFYSDVFPFYKPTDLEAGYNVRKASDNLSEIGLKEARFLPADSILVTCIGATIGKTGIIRRAGASNQQINAIIPSHEYNPNFIYYQVIAPKFQTAIKNNAAATTLPILNKSKFQNLDLIYCPIEEQQLIVEELESKLTVCDKIEETISQSLQRAETLWQSILKKAFEGRLVNEK